MASDLVLDVDAVSSGYGRIRALDAVSVTVPSGGIVALLGPNGAGKSTLLRTVSGLVRPWSGRIAVAGADVTRAAPDAIARAGVAHVPEGRGLFADMSVAENLLVGCEGLEPAETEAAIARAMELFPVLGERRRQRAGTLSGGEQQMLAIARALCRRPRLLMLDEMSQGLAPIVVAELFERLGAIRSEGTAVLLVEQYAAAALDVADDVYVLDKGRVAFHGTPAELAKDEDAMREAYLGTSALERGLAPDADRPTEEVLIRISPKLRRQYEDLAARLGTSVGDQVRAALAAHLATTNGSGDVSRSATGGQRRSSGATGRGGRRAKGG